MASQFALPSLCVQPTPSWLCCAPGWSGCLDCGQVFLCALGVCCLCATPVCPRGPGELSSGNRLGAQCLGAIGLMSSPTAALVCAEGSGACATAAAGAQRMLVVESLDNAAARVLPLHTHNAWRLKKCSKAATRCAGTGIAVPLLPFLSASCCWLHVLFTQAATAQTSWLAHNGCTSVSCCCCCCSLRLGLWTETCGACVVDSSFWEPSKACVCCTLGCTCHACPCILPAILLGARTPQPGPFSCFEELNDSSGLCTQSSQRKLVHG